LVRRKSVSIPYPNAHLAFGSETALPRKGAAQPKTAASTAFNLDAMNAAQICRKVELVEGAPELAIHYDLPADIFLIRHKLGDLFILGCR
jgi:hypothetical protein